MSTNLEQVSGTPQPESATADDTSPPPAASAVAHLIASTHKQIASAHEHGRKAVGLRDVLIARMQFAIARRLARLAWSFAAAGKRRVAG
ncbi:MAG: hypothetical protein RJB26_2430 [Pseudomonadota bacterium]